MIGPIKICLACFVLALIAWMLLVQPQENPFITVELSIDGNVERLYLKRETDAAIHIICDNGKLIDLQEIRN